MTVAFDYDRQEWVEGAAARPILIAQIKESLGILYSDRGGAYIVNTRKRGDPVRTAQEWISNLEGQLRALATT